MPGSPRALYVRPPEPLGRFVDVLWYFESGAEAHAFERLLPTGTMELVVNLAEERTLLYGEDAEVVASRGSAVVCGAHTRQFLIETASRRRVAGAHFKPGGGYPFVRPPAGELRDEHLSLDDLWPRAEVERLTDAMRAARDPAAILDALGRALLANAARALEPHPAVRYALAELDRVGSAPTVGELTDRVGLSARRFIDVFTAEVGLTPKLYARVRRFQEVVRRVHARREVDWTRVATACGYYDQSHFIRDFRAFSGLSPSAYFALRGEHVNHVPVA